MRFETCMHKDCFESPIIGDYCKKHVFTIVCNYKNCSNYSLVPYSFCLQHSIEVSKSKRPPAREEEKTIVNDQGGKQSDVAYAFHLMPIKALLAMAACIKQGHDKYDSPGDQQNWKKISIAEHKNHEISHSYLGLSGDTSDNHFVNSAVRAMFALQLYLENPE